MAKWWKIHFMPRQQHDVNGELYLHIFTASTSPKMVPNQLWVSPPQGLKKDIVADHIWTGTGLEVLGCCLRLLPKKHPPNFFLYFFIRFHKSKTSAGITVRCDSIVIYFYPLPLCILGNLGIGSDDFESRVREANIRRKGKLFCITRLTVFFCATSINIHQLPSISINFKPVNTIWISEYLSSFCVSLWVTAAPGSDLRLQPCRSSQCHHSKVSCHWCPACRDIWDRNGGARNGGTP